MPKQVRKRSAAGTFMVSLVFLSILMVIPIQILVVSKISAKGLVNVFESKIRCIIDIKKILFGTKEERHHNCTHVLLLTQMRSGSSFTARLLTMDPSTFYTEEPVRELFGDEVNSSEVVEKFVDLLRDLLHCRFTTRSDYYSKRLLEMHYHNLATHKLCTVYKDLCHDPVMDEAFCTAARTRFVRLVNVDLKDIVSLIRDPDLNVKVIHLIRDPRGLITSRELIRMFVRVTGNMTDARLLCDRYDRDLRAAGMIVQEYPDRYTLLRYEDLSLHSEDKLRELFAFMGTPYTALVADRAAVLTKGVIQGDYDPFGYRRNSSTTVSRWRRILPFERVSAIQRECQGILQSYGYRIFRTEEELRDESLKALVTPKMKVKELEKFLIDDVET